MRYALHAVSGRHFTKSYSLTCEKFISIFHSFFLETTKLSAQSLRILARLLERTFRNTYTSKEVENLKQAKKQGHDTALNLFLAEESLKVA